MPLSSSEEYRKDAFSKLREMEWLQGDCNCNICIEERIEYDMKEAVSIIYPALSFFPFILENYDDSIIKYLCKLRCKNEELWEDNKYVRVAYCKWCGKISPCDKMKVFERDDKRYLVCNGCFSNLFKCEECGESYEDVDEKCKGYKDGKKLTICYRCRDNYYFYCSYCDRYYYNTERVANEEKCLDRYGNKEYYVMCEKCYNEDKVKCAGCDNVTNMKTGHELYLEIPSKYYCSSCKEEKSINRMEYHYKPLRLNFNRLDTEGSHFKDSLYMGCEVEVGISQDINMEELIRRIKNKIGNKYVYCMRDGSISQATGMDGLEVVTHPFTWGWYREQGIDKFNDLFTLLRDMECESNLPGVGFHVHTTKLAWSTFQIYKLLKFIYTNESFIYRIAQRMANEYCKVKYDEGDTSFVNTAVYTAKNKRNRGGAHYNSINLNNTGGKASNTIEFRMFQGFLEPFYVHKNIEFVYATWVFTREGSRMREDYFRKFISDNSRQFPCLNNYLKEI